MLSFKNRIWLSHFGYFVQCFLVLTDMRDEKGGSIIHMHFPVLHFQRPRSRQLNHAVQRASSHALTFHFGHVYGKKKLQKR